MSLQYYRRPAMPLSFDIAILGLGAVGSWALQAAVAQKLRAVGVERFGLGHSRGSSHGGARVTRSAYFEHPDYVPLIRWSTGRLEALEKIAGCPLLERCGTLLLGEEESSLLIRSSKSARQFGIATEQIPAAELRTRFPQFDLPKSFVGLLEPDAGFVRVEPSLVAARRQAQELGAHVLDNTEVKGLISTADGVIIQTSSKELIARAVVICAGAWTPEFLPELRPWLNVTRQVQAWIRSPSHATPRITPDAMPCWLIDRPGQPPLYGIPHDPLDPTRGAKIAVHGDGVRTTPTAVSRAVLPAEDAALQHLVERWLSRTQAKVSASNVCLYTSTADGHFIVETTPKDPRIAVVAGLSGHGFKMAPALGYAGVELALHGRSTLPIRFLSRRGRSPFGGAAPRA